MMLAPSGVTFSTISRASQDCCRQAHPAHRPDHFALSGDTSAPGGSMFVLHITTMTGLCERPAFALDRSGHAGGESERAPAEEGAAADGVIGAAAAGGAAVAVDRDLSE